MVDENNNVLPGMTPQMFEWDLESQITCAKRELAMRIQVYPRFLESKKISHKHAERELGCMRAIILTLEGIQDARAKQKDHGGVHKP